MRPLAALAVVAAASCTTAAPHAPARATAPVAVAPPAVAPAAAVDDADDASEWPAWRLALGGAGVAADEPRALALFHARCERGDVDACAAAGHILSRPRRTTADLAAGKAALRDACARGAWMGCAWLAGLARSGATIERAWLEAGPKTPASPSQLERACDHGFAVACRAWEAAAPERVHEARARACALGDAESCAAYARDAARGPGAPAGDGSFTPLSTAEALAVACDHGWRDACRAQKTPAGTERACALGDEDACKEVIAGGGRALAVAPWAKHGLEARLGLCEEGGDLRMCGEAGIDLLDGEGVEPRPAAAAALLERACDGGEPSGCAGLAYVLDANPALPTATGVVAASSTACQLGVPQACCMWERHAQSSKTRAQARALGERCVAFFGRYLSLRDLRVHRFATTTPGGEYVRGSVIEGEFVPDGDVEGRPAATSDGGRPGYLELGPGTFMGQQEARKPRPPYLEGRLTDEGFIPSSRSVHRT